MNLLAISVGQPQQVQWQGQDVWTSIFKSPVTGSVEVKSENIVGDRQADLRVHGGLDKAVYAYSFDTYTWWKQKLGLDTLPYGSFGENLTMTTLDETQIFAGDVFEIGSCVLQAVQPRIPCYKLAIRFGNPDIIEMFNDYHRSGVYFRVLTEGRIQAGDSLRVVSSEKIRVSMSELFQFIKDRGVTSKARATEIAQISSLNTKWREKFRRISQDPD
jgi:MOSC domain-containing protein YiiM